MKAEVDEFIAAFQPSPRNIKIVMKLLYIERPQLYRISNHGTDQTNSIY